MLDGAERLELVQSQLRPKAEFTFSWDKLSQLSGLRTKDLIAPSVLDFKPDGRADCYRADGTWCRVLVFRGFGSDLEDDCIANVVDLPMPLNVTLHIHPMGKAAAVAYVKKRIAWMDKEVIDEQMSAVKKGYDFSILPPELSHSKEEAEELLDQLQNKNQRLFTYTGLVFTYADTAEALDHQTPPDHGGGAPALHRGGAAFVPPAPGHELDPAFGAQPRGGFALHDDRADRHTDALRLPGAQPGRRRLLRPVQAVGQPRHLQPQEAREPHGVRLRQAGLGQELQRQARDHEHYPGLSRRRGDRLRPGGRVRAGRGARGRDLHTLLAGHRHVHEPLRPLRRRRQGQPGAARLQDRRDTGTLERDHGRGARGAARGGQVDHQPLRGACLHAL